MRGWRAEAPCRADPPVVCQGRLPRRRGLEPGLEVKASVLGEKLGLLLDRGVTKSGGYKVEMGRERSYRG